MTLDEIINKLSNFYDNGNASIEEVLGDVAANGGEDIIKSMFDEYKEYIGE